MALPPDELGRRIRAARILASFEDRRELGRLFAEDGLGLHDVARLERGQMAMQRVHRDALARHLRVPPKWFTVPDLHAWLQEGLGRRLVDEEGFPDTFFDEREGDVDDE